MALSICSTSSSVSLDLQFCSCNTHNGYHGRRSYCLILRQLLHPAAPHAKLQSSSSPPPVSLYCCWSYLCISLKKSYFDQQQWHHQHQPTSTCILSNQFHDRHNIVFVTFDTIFHYLHLVILESSLGSRHPLKMCGGFHCTRNALTSLNVLYIVSSCISSHPYQINPHILSSHMLNYNRSFHSFWLVWQHMERLHQLLPTSIFWEES